MLVCEGSGLINFGKLSFAVTRARGLSREFNQLVEQIRMSPTGDVAVDVAEEKSFWFGFQAQMSSTQDFQFRIPIANQAFLLLSTLDSVNLSSPEVIVEPVASPLSYLPENWPDTSNLARSSISASRQWWLIHLGGVEQFSLKVSENELASNDWFRHIVRFLNFS